MMVITNESGVMKTKVTGVDLLMVAETQEEDELLSSLFCIFFTMRDGRATFSKNERTLRIIKTMKFGGKF